MSQPAKKMNKPLMEKKRRARINSCLTELKTLVLEEMKKDQCSRISYSKLEKADILEMTVQYLRNLQRQQIVDAASMDPAVIEKYISGYTECTNEVARYMNLMEGVDEDSKHNLMKHLNSGVQTVAGAKSVPTSSQAPRCKQPYRSNESSHGNKKAPTTVGRSDQSKSTTTLQTPTRHHTSLSVEALERLTMLPIATDSTETHCNTYSHIVSDRLTPIDIKPQVTDPMFNKSPKDFDSVDSGICDRVHDCSNSSISSSDEDRDHQTDDSEQHFTDYNNNNVVMSDVTDDDDFVWRPW